MAADWTKTALLARASKATRTTKERAKTIGLVVAK